MNSTLVSNNNIIQEDGLPKIQDPNPKNFVSRKKVDFMSRLFDFYRNSIQGKVPSSNQFWDLVVISAGDDDQKSW